MDCLRQVRRVAVHLLTTTVVLLTVLCWPQAGQAQSSADCTEGDLLAGSTVSLRLDPSTQWQPRGGNVRITAKSDQDLSRLDADATMVLIGEAEGLKAPVAEISIESAKAGEVVYLVEVPQLIRPDDPQTQFLWLIPTARLALTLSEIGNDGCTKTRIYEIGITSPWFAACGVAVFLAVLYGGAWFFKKVAGRPETGTLLFPLETAQRRASLSQFQIMFWSVLVASSAIYVMMLSGNLIEITSGTLILLGIAGGASIMSAWQYRREDREDWAPQRRRLFEGKPSEAPPAKPKTLDGESDDAKASAETSPFPMDGDFYVDLDAKVVYERIDGVWRLAEKVPFSLIDDKGRYASLTGTKERLRLTDEGRERLRDHLRRPRWRQLFEGRPGEVDPARLQMLLFTAVTGVFVVLTVARNFVIPEIPEGYLVLMGISNGVYLGGKLVSS